MKTFYYEKSNGRSDVIQIEGRVYQFYYDDNNYVVKTSTFNMTNVYHIYMDCTPENTDFLARILKVKIDGYKLNNPAHLLKEIQ